MFVNGEEGGGGGHLDLWSIHIYASTTVADDDEDVPSLTLAIAASIGSARISRLARRDH